MRRRLRAIAQIGKMGHLEVARSHAACVRNLLFAGGAGLVTAITVVLKLVILHSPLTFVVTGALSAANFILSFLFMQLFGFRLATKQSPLLGAALGRSWQKIRSLWHDEVQWALRTQLFSAGGNLFFVIPAAFVFCALFKLTTGSQFLEPQAARAALAALDPWRLSTLGYAALTGCLLWLCTWLGGALAQWFRPFSKSLATALFNICLGALLALVPLAGKKLGLPLDVRHFTLSGGTAAVAAASLGPRAALHAGLASAIAGVLAIGMLNFSVSFALAFTSARRDTSPWRHAPARA